MSVWVGCASTAVVVALLIRYYTLRGAREEAAAVAAAVVASSSGAAAKEDAWAKADGATYDKALHDSHWSRVETARKAAKKATSTESVINWLNETREHLGIAEARGAPEQIRRILIREEAKIYMSWIPWAELLAPKAREFLLAPAGALLPKYFADLSWFPNCCADYFCVSGQVRLALILKELEGGAVGRADTQLQAFRALVQSREPAFDAQHCHGVNLGTLSASKLHSPITDHFPKEYFGLAPVDRAYWPVDEVPVAKLLENNAAAILEDFRKLQMNESVFRSTGIDDRGTGKVDSLVSVDSAADGWSELEIFDGAGWHEDVCAIATEICKLLRPRPELQGRLLSRMAAHGGAGIQVPSVVIYRLSPKTKLVRHIGNTWRLNIHFGLVTTPHAKLIAWGEERRWEDGKALVFTDAAEHAAENTGDESRYVLDVMIWHPDVLREREKNPHFAAMWESEREEEAE